MEYHLATKRQAQINVLLSIEWFTLYVPSSLIVVNYTDITNGFSGIVTPADVLMPLLSLLIHSVSYALYHFTLIPYKWENKRFWFESLIFKGPSFPQAGPDQVSTQVNKTLSILLMCLCSKWTNMKEPVHIATQLTEVQYS